MNRSAGRKPLEAERVGRILAQSGVEARVHAPGSPGEMSRLIRECAEAGAERFAVAGGDGTVNLAVNALIPLGLPKPPVLGVLPTGTGCDLLRTFGLPQELSAAASHLVGEDTYPIDIGVLEGAWGTRYFANVAQVGVGAAAAATAAKLARGFGTARYPLAFVGRLPRFPRAEVRVVTERRVIESEALAVIMANAQFFAGGWNVAPKATLVDGVLDIQVIDCRKTDAPALVPKIIKGTHLGDPAVRRFSSGRFSIETNPVWPVECDGDLVGNTPVTGRVLAAAISLKI